jgi:hypothetical protein
VPALIIVGCALGISIIKPSIPIDTHAVAQTSRTRSVAPIGLLFAGYPQSGYCDTAVTIENGSFSSRIDYISGRYDVSPPGRVGGRPVNYFAVELIEPRGNRYSSSLASFECIDTQVFRLLSIDRCVIGGEDIDPGECAKAISVRTEDHSAPTPGTPHSNLTLEQTLKKLNDLRAGTHRP